jgi:hypothetical protein
MREAGVSQLLDDFRETILLGDQQAHQVRRLYVQRNF